MFASYRRMSFFSKTLLFSVVNILLVGIILTTASYFIQKSLMLKSLHAQAKGILGQTKITLNMKDIEAAISNLDIASPGQKKLIKQFTDLASANKNISQAYILDPKLENGKQMLIAAPQYVIDAGYKPGSMYESPPIYREVIQKTIDTKEMGVTDTYSDDLGTWISVIEPIVDDKGNMIALLGMDIDASLITKGQQELLLWLVPCLFAALLLVVLFQLFILRKVLAPLKDLFGAINQVAEGNLNVELRVTREDDFGVLSKQFNRMIQKIRQVVERVQVTAEETVGSSQTLLTHVEENKKATYQVTETFQEMATGAENQVHSTEESARAMEEMAVGIQRVAESSTIVAETALESSKEAERGNESIQRTIQQMNAIQTSVTESVSLVKLLGKRSNQVESIVDVITGIASQTNLLALNAAIEAARAGEHGKGFAVVADEVRKLAEQATTSAQQIITLIHEIGSDTMKTIQAMDLVTSNVESGMEAVDKSGEAFRRILEAVQNVSAQIQEISAVSEQMSASSEEVTASVEEIAHISKSSASHSHDVALLSTKQLQAMQEVAASVENLYERAIELRGEIQIFRI